MLSIPIICTTLNASTHMSKYEVIYDSNHINHVYIQIKNFLMNKLQ